MVEKAIEEKFVHLRMLVEEGKRQKMIETDRQKNAIEDEIAEVEEKIKEKDEELGRLMSEVEVLRKEILEGVVVIEKGGMKKKEKVELEKKGKEKEMKMLDLNI